MKIANSITNYYVKRSIITDEQEEIFKLGISLFVGAVLNYSVILLLACAAGQITYGITFLICFYFTRIFCGGYHARTVGKCRGVFIGTFILVLLAANICPSRFVLMTIIIGNVVSFIMVAVFAPVEHPNKPLTLEQSKKARRHGVTVICLLLCVEFLLYQLSRPECLVIALTLFSVAILMPIGIYENRKGGEESEKVTG